MGLKSTSTVPWSKNTKLSPSEQVGRISPGSSSFFGTCSKTTEYPNPWPGERLFYQHVHLHRTLATQTWFEWKRTLFSSFLATRPHVNDTFCRKNRVFRKRSIIQSGAIRRWQFSVYVQTAKLETLEHNDISVGGASLQRMLNRQVVVFSNRCCIYVWTGW